jgi:hypothetical protein
MTLKELLLPVSFLCAWVLTACGPNPSSAASIGAQGSANVAPGFTAPDPNRPVGLLKNTGEAEDGYVLVSLIQSKDVILLSNDGRVVNIWRTDDYPRLSAYLLDNGNLLRAASVDNIYGFTPTGQWSFIGGRIEELTWDGEVAWSFEYVSEDHVGHHDIWPMPNGHILMVAFERFTEEEALAAGFDRGLMPQRKEIWSEAVLEIDPATDEIVWEWHLWDHLIQDVNENAENFGVVADHPQRVNLNYQDPELTLEPNWWHINSVAYNAKLDQIVLSTRRYSEIWIIDHSITTEEARGEAGDLLYRWGNPLTYDTGTDANRQLYFQHNPTWIPDGYPGEGNILIFDNGGQVRPYSRVVEITPPLDETGQYSREVGQPFGPETVTWEYVAENPTDFFSYLISSAQRQPNGNTLITEGLLGHIFEVDAEGEIVWEYNLPPTSWAFKSARYNLPMLADDDMTGSLEFVGSEVWGVDCTDGSQPRLYQYLPEESATMSLFIGTHGDIAQDVWETEACAEHGGRGDVR